MAANINTNIQSLNAQRNLGISQNALSKSMERLSSGLRINSARDDAAGLAISERFSTQIRGLDVAARNANDGISLAQTAEGAMASVTNNLQRMRELAVQSANATNSGTDRAALQQEVAQLVQEIDRVATQTDFNGTKLLDGNFTSQAFQVGANAGQTITIDKISSARTGTLGQEYKASVSAAALDGTQDVNLSAITINGKAIGSATAVKADAKTMVNAINAAGIAGVRAEITGSTTVAAAVMTPAALTGTITINGVTTASITTTLDAATSRANVLKGINDISAATGVTATDNGSGIVLTAADGRNITHSFTTLTSAATGVGTADTTESGYKVTYSGVEGGKLDIAGTVANSGLTVATTTVALAGTAIANVDISDVTGANTALASIDAALTAINSSRAALGAIQNRFSSTIDNLRTNSENLNASRSRIVDADFAAETANLSRAQILQQAGTAMVAQANQLPQGVLSLLR
ncbi:flagellin [Acidovorax carolinensis]|uniref:flagellin n=1 Tax=Acidovorax carolinensis TaxID=553814 RepID=UPI000B34104F|nr:flagellin [Acidovorax carolinensis]ART49445.1 flagellin [Acidovorax carolinensis]